MYREHFEMKALACLILICGLNMWSVGCGPKQLSVGEKGKLDATGDTDSILAAIDKPALDEKGKAHRRARCYGNAAPYSVWEGSSGQKRNYGFGYR